MLASSAAQEPILQQLGCLCAWHVLLGRTHQLLVQHLALFAMRVVLMGVGMRWLGQPRVLGALL